MSGPGVQQAHGGWRDHVIVCGLHGVGLRTVEQLLVTGRQVVVVDDEPERRLVRTLQAWQVPLLEADPRSAGALERAGLADALAVVCVEEDDLQRLETALAVREQRPDVRLVVQLANAAVGRALSEVLSAGSVLDAAALAAPAVLDACSVGRPHVFAVDSARFSVSGQVVRAAGTLRAAYGDRVPLAVLPADGGPLVVCPGRDHEVGAGDRVTLIDADDADPGRRPRVRLPRVRPRVPGLLRELDRPLKVALLAVLLLLLVSTVVLKAAYRQPDGSGISWLDALYFTVSTDATVGFGDFNFGGQDDWLMAFGIVDMLIGAALLTTVFALFTNLLVSRRLAAALGRQRVTGMRDHVVVVGLGSIGIAVLQGLLARGRDVVVLERDEDNRYLAQARALGVTVVLGDATLALSLEQVNVRAAGAIAILTSNEMTNIETGLAVREHLGPRWPAVPVVLRVFDRPLAATVERTFGFRHVLSASMLAAPWFVGAALGLEVLDTFYVERTPFLLARLTVAVGGGLDGLAMRELSAATRVVALERAGGGLEHPPRRGTRFAGGDRAYLVGPYEELLGVLQQDQREAG